MLTKTRLDNSVFEEMSATPDLAKYFIRDLANNALLILKVEELRELETKIPTNVYLHLREAIERRIIACREPLNDIEATRLLRPEVYVGSEGKVDEFGRAVIQMIDYAEAPPVLKRSYLKAGADQINDREEFWKWVLEPLVSSLSPKNRVIDLVDQFLFQNVERGLAEYRRTKQIADLDRIGLNWLIRKLANSSNGLPHKTKINIYTAERGVDDGISKKKIESLIEEVSPVWDTRLLDFRIYVVPKNLLIGEVKVQLHNRRIVLNQRYFVGLDRGFDDLSVYYRGKAAGTVADIDGSWHYFPDLASDSGRHNTNVLKSTISRDEVLDLIETK